MQLILGSKSPRRLEILSYFSLSFQQVSSHFDEESIVYGGDPFAYVTTLAKKKGDSLILDDPSIPILTADTLVVRKNRCFGKPSHFEEAVAMLEELSGNWHTVLTSLCLTTQKGQYTETEETRVLFQSLSRIEIECYLEKTHAYDKAGGYAIQKGGSLIIQRIEGCFYNVMGLPIQALKKLLEKIDINLWDYLKTAEEA